MRIASMKLLFILACLIGFNAHALEKEPFTMERFEALQAQGEIILVDIYADWCPTCARQQQVLADFIAEHPAVAFHILEVNWDDDKEWVRHFRAPSQSTLLLFVGEDQYWFSVAETRPEQIATQINRAFMAQVSAQ
jgi:thioredoxin 1